MSLLLETHAMLWFWPGELLGTGHQDPYWQDCPAYGLWTFLGDRIARDRFQILPVELRHTAVLTTLPMHHRDPFDRLLVAHAMVEDMPIASNDPALDAYPIRRIW